MSGRRRAGEEGADNVRYVLMLEAQQGLTYDDQLAIARRAEAAGFEALFRSDHYESFPGPAGRPTTDAWTVLAGLARETDRIRLGVLVSPVTFRPPGTIAKIAATLDHMSGGRIELGLGAGWNEDEHRRHGVPFPPIAERADMLEEQLAIVHGLWDEPDGWSFAGRHYRVEDTVFQPKPLQRAAPADHRRWRGLAAVAADRGALRRRVQPDLVGPGPSRRPLRAARRGVPGDRPRSGHDPPLGDGRDADRSRRLPSSRHGSERCWPTSAGGAEAEAWFGAREARWILGTPDEARAKVAAFEAAGVQRLCSRTSCRSTSR